MSGGGGGAVIGCRFPLLCHLGRFALLSNFHSLLGFAFVVKMKAANVVGLCKGVEK